VSYEILPGILEPDWPAIERKLELVRPFAGAVHVDLLDGRFAPNRTFADPTPFARYAGDLFLEVHLMVEEPADYLEPFAQAGFRRFLGHVERMSDQAAFVARGRRLGEVGLAVDGPSAADAVTVPVSTLDCLLVMTITAGFSGQPFVPAHLDKVRAFRARTPAPIEVDGGVRDTTGVLAREAGATRFVTTSYLFGAPDPGARYHALHRCLAAPVAPA
jgi:ribulose-phosphate 3-epimerase